MSLSLQSSHVKGPTGQQLLQSQHQMMANRVDPTQAREIATIFRATSLKIGSSCDIQLEPSEVVLSNSLQRYSVVKLGNDDSFDAATWFPRI